MANKKELYLMLIGARIRYYRKISNLKQEELARRIGISISALQRIEQGNYNKSISLTTLLDIADGLHIDVQLLLNMNETEKRLMDWN